MSAKNLFLLYGRGVGGGQKVTYMSIRFQKKTKKRPKVVQRLQLWLSNSLREDTHKKAFFSGRTTKGVGGVNPPDH